MYNKFINSISILCFILLFVCYKKTEAKEFSDQSFIVAKVDANNYRDIQLWKFIRDNNRISIELDIDSLSNNAFLKNSNYRFITVLERINSIILENDSKIIPVFINYSGNIHLLDSVINKSSISPYIFYLPQGEKWPSTEYLVQANRRVIFFVQGQTTNESRILHSIKDYALQIQANNIIPKSAILDVASNINRELFVVNNFHLLPTGIALNRHSRDLVPDYINFLLEVWKKFGKKPNFIFAEKNTYNFDFIIDQLNSFGTVNGIVRTAGKNAERVYWRNPEVLVTGGKFSFPIRGGEELTLSPFAPGYSMTPEQIIVTNEMQYNENHVIMASPISLSEGMTANFQFEKSIKDLVNPSRIFEGKNYSFSQDIERGSVLRLPENASIALGHPSLYGLRNSSFTVSSFVKFTDILEHGDNAILGNDEQGYRRGMHLVLRSGHPYFGLWANDFMSGVKLETQKWYHLVWRYIIETGEQAIFVNGKFVGGSDGHQPYSGSSNLHIGSALSRGASMRGYIDNLQIWNRPLGKEQIVRLSSGEEVVLKHQKINKDFFANNTRNIALGVGVLLFSIIILWLVFKKTRLRKEKTYQSMIASPEKNQIQFFGKFKAINKDQENVSELFTPKVKELFAFTLLHTLKNRAGAPVSELNNALWHGIEPKKAANNRAVTLNKLRKILAQFDTVEVVSASGYLQLKTSGTFFCDYMEVFELLKTPKGMINSQLEVFFNRVKRGTFLKQENWLWLDEIRGFVGSQVTDNLLKLATTYKKEKRIEELEKVAQRILDYDDLNEEAIYFKIWALQETNNTNLARFNFNSFCSTYERSLGEPFAMDFKTFTKLYSEKL